MKNKEKTTYIALLRGINVGGHNVKMDVLRNLFTSLGFKNVRSYIQSGNIFFESDENNKEVLRKKIEHKLETALNYNVPVALRTLEEMETLLEQNPFRSIALTPDARFAVTFLSQPTTIDLALPYKTPNGGYEVIGKTPTELFVVWHLLHGRPGNSYGLIEKKVGIPTTTRFWHTLAKIVSAAKS